jgi:2-keto-3-deoxy-L-rhamnonate aldolase RhmA
MSCSRLRHLIDSDRVAVGIWITLRDPLVVELAAKAGYDYVSIDMEHTPFSLETAEHLVRAADAAGVSSLVRVPDAGWIVRALELGCDGVVVPHMTTAETARCAVSAARFPPLGTRGLSMTSRAATIGDASADFGAYADRANKSLIVYVQIEDREGIQNAGAIAAVPGLDVCGIAPADLTSALGLAGTRNDPRVGDAIRQTASRIVQAGNAKLAIPLRHSAYAYGYEELVDMGARVLNYGHDTRNLARALATSMQELRR